jgi:hypothetical protein
MADKPMAVYLNDHLAGATFGSDLARQIESRSAEPEVAARLGEVAGQIEADHESLVALMKRLEITANPVKQAATWVGEKLSRVKLTGTFSGEDDQGLFMALEMLSMGVEGKALLWRMLRDVADRYEALDANELDVLIARADSQREVLEVERLSVGQRAFTGPGD